LDYYRESQLIALHTLILPAFLIYSWSHHIALETSLSQNSTIAADWYVAKWSICRKIEESIESLILWFHQTLTPTWCIIWT
jgi:hypothetical protein